MIDPLVTREHRLAAVTAFGWAHLLETNCGLAQWVEDGDERNLLPNRVLQTTARAIAAAERGAEHRAWHEGWDACSNDDDRRPNPYDPPPGGASDDA